MCNVATSTRSRVVDRHRILAKLDELDGYLQELRSILPDRLEDYLAVEKKRACERLVQISVEAALDVCALLVTGLRLGLPGEEDDLFDKLLQAHVLSSSMIDTLRRLKGLRNLLVHEYGRIVDSIVFPNHLLASRGLRVVQAGSAGVPGSQGAPPAILWIRWPVCDTR